MLKYRLFFIAQLSFLSFAFCQNTLESSSIKIDSINSHYLHEIRKVVVYLPENFDSNNLYPIIYATDGQSIVELDYKSLLDSLIEDKRIPPVILIGAYSNETIVSKNVTLRYYEYVKKGDHPKEYIELYRNHSNFFKLELNQYIQEKLNIQNNLTKSIFYGCSNGGGFGISTFIENRKQFNYYICFSPLGISYDGLKRNKKSDTKLTIAYGEEENFILIGKFAELHQKLNKKNINHEFYSFKGGHDQGLWKMEFANNLIKLLN
jgi:enterochelin esterase-like enzyme